MNTNNNNKQNYVFLWDLHEVILKKSIWNWILLFIKFPEKIKLISHLNKKSIKIILIFLLESLHLTKKQMVSEELIRAAQESKNNALVDFIIQICTSYTPISSTLDLLQDLSEKGYKHYIGSNIGNPIYAQSVEKFPSVFQFFSGFIIPFYNSNTIIKKPNPKFFRTFTEQYNVKPEDVIFIDDKIQNIKGAQAIGMKTFLFKNSRDLRKQIIEKGLL